MTAPADGGPPPREWHTFDPAAGRCDRVDCAANYDRCPARGVSVPYDASGWPKRARPQAPAPSPLLPPAPAPSGRPRRRR